MSSWSFLYSCTDIQIWMIMHVTFQMNIILYQPSSNINSPFNRQIGNFNSQKPRNKYQERKNKCSSSFEESGITFLIEKNSPSRTLNVRSGWREGGGDVLFLFVSWSWKLGMLEIKPNYRENRDGGVTTKVWRWLAVVE